MTGPDSIPGDVDPAVAHARELLLEERRSIDNIDAALVHLLAERFSHTQRVGVLKAEHGLPPADPSREARSAPRRARRTVRRHRRWTDPRGWLGGWGGESAWCRVWASR